MLQCIYQQLISYSNYESAKTHCIGNHTVYYRQFYGSVSANSIYSYSEYLRKIPSFNCIQVNNVESNPLIRRFILRKFNIKRMINCSIFSNFRTAYSLPLHKDNYNVLIYLIRGRKKIQIANKKFSLHTNQGMIIPKNFSHLVKNTKNSHSLSIAYRPFHRLRPKGFLRIPLGRSQSSLDTSL